MKVFITGGAGFIGYHVAKKLLSRGHEVVIYDNFLNFVNPLESHYPFYLQLRLNDLKDKVQIIRGDVRNRGCLVKALKETQPDIVIHMAAIPLANISNQYSEEATQINLNGTITVLESIRVVECVKKFVYTSSSFVYGNFIYHPANECHPTDPIDLYGGTKLCGEILTKVYGQRFGIDYAIIRPSAVYGPTDCNRRVSQIFVEDALQGKPLTVDSNCGKVDFTYIDDTAEGFALASLSSIPNETFNITMGQGRSAGEYANIIAKYIPSIEIISKESKTIRPERGALSIDMAKTFLDYEPQYPLEKGIPLYLEFVKSCGVLK
jgi:UDP-glucose 4-epimerase